MSSDGPRLVVLSHEPFNAETVLGEHHGVVTPTHSFYKRNHFPIPEIDLSTWTLSIGGVVQRELTLTYSDLLALPRRSLLATMECAGNGRVGFEPAAIGEPWQYGAVSTAEWTGTPLRAVLQASGLGNGVQEVQVTGMDAGHVEDAGGPIGYERSLPISRALHPDTLIAYAMNGDPLLSAHGFPARLIVPGWYGMASVKWLTRIEAVTTPFEGFYQHDRYVMVDPRDERRRVPLGEMRVRSLFTWPTAGATLQRGRHYLRGLAWSGSAEVQRVEVSTDGGQSWLPAELTGDRHAYAWCPWEAIWDATESGSFSLQCRAFDAAGGAQPGEPPWNHLGYANNAIQRVSVTVR